MKKLLVANYKMNGDKNFYKEVNKIFNNKKFKDTILLCPPFVYMPFFNFKSENVFLGSQDIASVENKKSTGQISAKMLNEFNVNYTLIGHSERRELYETNEIVANKVKYAQENNITPIVCVGEKDKNSGIDVLIEQVEIALSKTQNKNIIFAYEPIWAIGTGEIPTVEQIEKAVLLIKETANNCGFNVKVLYGGSVNGNNYKEILTENVDGLLMGGVSLKIEEFLKIVKGGIMNKGILVILDGYGEGKPYEFNAVTNAKTPTLFNLKKQSHSMLKTHGDAVGLFDEELGGSEVGHLTIGAGRIVNSTAKQIREDIKSKEFHKNKVLTNTLNALKKNNSNLHLFGLMSDKNIHSDISHCVEIVKLATGYANNIFIHFITDGRDSGAFDSLKYFKYLKNETKNIKNCSILSVSGRFYAMDRENHEERTNEAFNACFMQNNPITNIEKYITSQHSEGKNDQFVKPVSVKSETYKGVNKNDCVLFFNFREDRMRQIVKKCEELKCDLVTMSDVGGTKTQVMYPNKITKNTLSEYLSENNLKQVKIGESTKYAHVTYFLNGGREEPFEREDRVHVPSYNVDDFAETPQMKAKEITKEVEKAIKKEYDAIIVNYSNADMVGHTGNYEATLKSLEVMDKCVKKLLKVAEKKDYFVMITADHGNADEMQTERGEPHMAHTINPVFCVVANSGLKMKKEGGLKDVAPTFVELMGLKPNKYFEGKSLIEK